MAELKPCPFCGLSGPKAGAHKADCYFSLSAALRDAPKGDLTSVPDILAAWNRRATPPSPSTAPTEQDQANPLPARRFVSVKGFWDADYVEFAEGCAKGGGVLNGVPHSKHYTRSEAEGYVAEGAWREVAVPKSVEQSSMAGAAKGGNTSAESIESGTAPTVEVDEFIKNAVTAAKVKFVHPEAATTLDIGRAVLAALASKPPAREDETEPLKWESTTPFYIRFITDSRYQKLRPSYQKWYKPICETCANSPAREAAERQSIEDDAEFQYLAGDVYRAGSYNESIEKPLRALIAHIDTWGARSADDFRDAERYRHIRNTANNGYDLRGPAGIDKWHVSRKVRDGEGEYLWGKYLDAAIDRSIGAAPAAGNTAQPKEQ